MAEESRECASTEIVDRFHKPFRGVRLVRCNSEAARPGEEFIDGSLFEERSNRRWVRAQLKGRRGEKALKERIEPGDLSLVCTGEALKRDA
jgi:hypothetical protein